jgi:hypothetical protein
MHTLPLLEQYLFTAADRSRVCSWCCKVGHAQRQAAQDKSTARNRAEYNLIPHQFGLIVGKVSAKRFAHSNGPPDRFVTRAYSLPHAAQTGTDTCTQLCGQLSKNIVGTSGALMWMSWDCYIHLFIKGISNKGSIVHVCRRLSPRLTYWSKQDNQLTSNRYKNDNLSTNFICYPGNSGNPNFSQELWQL